MVTKGTRSRLYFPTLVALTVLAAAQPAHSQSTTAPRAAGAWEGIVTIGGHPYALMVTLVHSDESWSGHFSYPAEGFTDVPLHEVTVAGDSIQFKLSPGFVFSGRLTPSGAEGEATNGTRTYPWTLARAGSPLAERLALRVREAIETARSAPLVEVARGPGADRVDAAALERLVEAAWEANSDAVVVLHDGELVGEWYRKGESRRIEAMSVTKSVVNLAIGRLVTLGAIQSIDLPVHTFYPEWREGVKSRITIRHLLDHTSGLRSDQGTGEIYASPDFIRLALDAEVTSEPGTVFFYNNKAVNLLAGIAGKAAGKRMDLFLRDDLFAKLGITDFTWSLDDAGNPHAMAGLQIHPGDLAKLGQLTLERGLWEGERLIDESWFEESLRAATKFDPYSGLLWWLIPDDPEELVRVIDAENLRALREVGVDEEVLAKVERLQGRYGSPDELIAAYRSVFGDDWRATLAGALGPRLNLLVRLEAGEIVGYRADGYLGQYIIIYPAERLVAVRMVESSPAYDQATDGFQEFQELVRGLVGVQESGFRSQESGVGSQDSGFGGKSADAHT